MKVIKLHGTWSRLVMESSGYLWLRPIPVPVKPDPLAAVMATITGNPLL